MKNGTLYRLDFSSGKSYVGITSKSAEKRFAEHAIAAKNNSQYLVHKAWRKYGPPRLIVLSILDSSILLMSEQAAVSSFGTLCPCGYNMTIGGEVSPGEMPEIAKKISNSMKGIKRSEDFKIKLRNRQFTDEWRAKLSSWQKGRKLSAEHSENIAAALRGKKRSQETRLKMSIANKGKKYPNRKRANNFQLMGNNQ